MQDAEGRWVPHCGSRIDYCCVRSSSASMVQGCHTDERMGRPLQLYDCPGERDHRPLVVLFRVEFPGGPNSPRQVGAVEEIIRPVAWDVDKLMKCL